MILLLCECAYGQDNIRQDTCLRWTHTISFEERDDVFFVNPAIRVESDRFIIADESEVRIYNLEGELVLRFGEPGQDAPGAMTAPTPAAQTNEGIYVVPDAITGHLNLFSSEGNFIKRILRVVAPAGTHDVGLLPDNKILLVGAS